MKYILTFTLSLLLYYTSNAQNETTYLTSTTWKIDQMYADKLPIIPEWKDTIFFHFADNTFSMIPLSMYSPTNHYQKKWSLSSDNQQIVTKLNDITIETYKIIFIRANVLILEQNTTSPEDQSTHVIEYRLIPYKP